MEFWRDFDQKLDLIFIAFFWELFPLSVVQA
jgi:hypothetical protein